MERTKIKAKRIPDYLTNQCDIRCDCSGNEFFVVNPDESIHETMNKITSLEEINPVTWRYIDSETHNELISKISELNIPLVLRTKTFIKEHVLRGMKNFWNTIVYETSNPVPDELVLNSMSVAFEGGLNVVVIMTIIPGVTSFLDVANFMMATSNFTRRYVIKFAETLASPVSEKYTEPNGKFFRATEDYRKKFLHQLDLVFSSEKRLSLSVCGSCKTCLGVKYFKYKKTLDIYMEVTPDGE